MMNKGLGRGLSALIPGNMTPGNGERKKDGMTVLVPISSVRPNVRQPRKTISQDSLEELAASIRSQGIIQPLIVRETGTPGSYEIIAGERRWRAARLAGLSEVPVVVIEADDRKAAELAMIENLQREDLNPMEEAAGFQSLVQTYHMTQEEAAEAVGKSRSAVTNALRLLTLCPAVRAMVEDGSLSAGHARALLTLPADVQEQAARSVVAGGLSVRQTEALVKKLTAEKETSADEPADKVDYAAEAQKDLASRLGRGVRIVTGRKKGRVELEYYGMDDLNDLLEALALLKIRRAKSEQK